MLARIFMAVIAGLATSVAAATEPSKAPVHKADLPTGKTAPVVVASADNSPVEAAKVQPDAAPEATKPRRGRATTCRCGDQLPNED
jgi:hypothetical protein